MRVIVGSHDLPVFSRDILSTIIGFISTADTWEPIAIRSPLNSDEPASVVERIAAIQAEALGHPVIKFKPTKGGREAVFRRDYEMMTDATAVLAFFSPEREMEGGTSHVVKAALDQGIPVEAYSVRPDGTLVYLGSDDGDPSRKTGSGPNEVLRRMWEEAQG